MLTLHHLSYVPVDERGMETRHTYTEDSESRSAVYWKPSDEADGQQNGGRCRQHNKARESFMGDCGRDLRVGATSETTRPEGVCPKHNHQNNDIRCTCELLC